MSVVILRAMSDSWAGVDQHLPYERQGHRGHIEVARIWVVITSRYMWEWAAIESTNVDTWVNNCTTVGASSTTNWRSCWASIPAFPASNFLWESAKLPIELGSSPRGRLDMAVEFCKAARCDEGWKCDGHVVTETRLWVSLFNKILTTSPMY